MLTAAGDADEGADVNADEDDDGERDADEDEYGGIN